MYDVIILGAGPAGISASLYTKRANLETLILYNDKSGLEKASLIENYYGFKNGISGKELYETGIEQAKNIGVEVKKEEVVKIENNIEYFNVVTNTNQYKAKNLILDAENKSETMKKEAILEAKEEAHRLRNEAERDARERRAEIQRSERRLIQKEESMDRKLENIEKKEESITQKEQAIVNKQKELDKVITFAAHTQ